MGMENKNTSTWIAALEIHTNLKILEVDIYWLIKKAVFFFLKKTDIVHN